MSDANQKGIGITIFQFLTCINQLEKVIETRGISRALLFKLQRDQLPERPTTYARLFNEIIGIPIPNFDDKNDVANFIKKLQVATRDKQRIYEFLDQASPDEIESFKLNEKIKENEKEYVNSIHNARKEDALIARLNDENDKIQLESYYTVDHNTEWLTIYIYFPEWICEKLDLESPISFDVNSAECPVDEDWSGNADITWGIIQRLKDAPKNRFLDEVIKLVNEGDLEWGNFTQIELLEDTLITRLNDSNNIIQLESYYSIDEQTPELYTFYIYFPEWICEKLALERPISFDIRYTEKPDLSDTADIAWELIQCLQEAPKSQFRDEVIELIHEDSNLDWGDLEKI